MHDLEAVIDDAISGEFDIIGSNDGAAIAIAYAARHPERVRRMLLGSPFASAARFVRRDLLESLIGLVRADWRIASRTLTDLSRQDLTAEQRETYARMYREVTSPETMAAYLELFASIDVDDEATRVRTPTLIFSQPYFRLVPPRETMRVAALIPGARLITVDEPAGVMGFDLSAQEGIINEFLLAEGVAEPLPRMPQSPVVRTVLFTDIVGHTRMMDRLGDEQGRAVLREHERITREVLARHGGVEVKTTGDGFMAAFSSVTAAVECAIALQRAFAAREGTGGEALAIRVGLNAGEPIEEDGDLFGSSVIVASRLAAIAEAGEILVPEAVRHLVSGKGFRFIARGEAILRGFEEAIRIHEVSWRDD